MAAQEFWAVVPVKLFQNAKRRLAPVLQPAERVLLAHLMLQDVLGAITACARLRGGIIVVTPDPQAAQTARVHGALALSDMAGGGINAAIGVALQHLAAIPNAAVIVVPSDIPQLAPSAIEEMMARMTSPRAVALVPATHDGGTNLLGCFPAGAIAPCFGTNSFRRHCRAAQQAGIVPSVVIRSDVGRDIDRPDDLAAFLSIGIGTRTHAFLAELGIAERLRFWSRQARSHSDGVGSPILEARATR